MSKRITEKSILYIDGQSIEVSPGLLFLADGDKIISEDSFITLDGDRYLLECGDRVTIFEANPYDKLDDTEEFADDDGYDEEIEWEHQLVFDSEMIVDFGEHQELWEQLKQEWPDWEYWFDDMTFDTNIPIIPVPKFIEFLVDNKIELGKYYDKVAALLR